MGGRRNKSMPLANVMNFSEHLAKTLRIVAYAWREKKRDGRKTRRETQSSRTCCSRMNIFPIALEIEICFSKRFLFSGFFSICSPPSLSCRLETQARVLKGVLPFQIFARVIVRFHLLNAKCGCRCRIPGGLLLVTCVCSCVLVSVGCVLLLCVCSLTIS